MHSGISKENDIIGGKKKHMNRTLCAHCGKEMAREENKVYLEVRLSLKKSKSCYTTNFVPTFCFLSVQTRWIHIPKEFV
jgi:phage FluMu protein Com